jgi:putative PIN family toxin of toxin-antitoxin system
MLDTNILISAIVFQSKALSDMVHLIADRYALVLCSYVIDELHEVVDDKFSSKKGDVERFLLELPFEFIYTPKIVSPQDMVAMRDKDDEKVLYSAMIADVDVLITGDKDFYEVDIDRPEILSPGDFISNYK